MRARTRYGAASRSASMSPPTSPKLEHLLAALETELAQRGGDGGWDPAIAERLQRLSRTARARTRPTALKDAGLGELEGLPEDFLPALEAEGGLYRGR